MKVVMGCWMGRCMRGKRKKVRQEGGWKGGLTGGKIHKTDERFAKKGVGSVEKAVRK